MRHRVLKALVLAAVVVGLVDLYRSDRVLFRKPAGAVDHYRAKLRVQLADERRVSLLFTADDLPGVNWASGKPVEISGAEGVRGHFGTALRFPGDRRSYVTFPVRWNELGASFTVAVRVKLDPASADQEILFTREREPLGLKLDRGRMSFFVPTGGAGHAAAQYAFTNYDRYVQLAAVVDGPAGVTRLYEDGALRAELPRARFEAPGVRLAMGRSSGLLIAEPLMGDVDEVVVWKRALAGDEVAAFAEADAPALEILVPRVYARLRRAIAVQAGIAHTLKLVDLFNPARHGTRLRAADVPEVNLVLSKADARHFAAAHRKSLRSGRRVESAATARRVEVIERGRVFEARLRLDGSDTRYAASPRRSWVLEPPPGETVLGLRRIRLAPPESSGWLGPLLETRVARELGVAAISNGWCRLVINGEAAGLYYFEDHARLGIATAGRGRMDQPPVPEHWPRLALQGLPPLTRDRLVALRSEVESANRGLLLNDGTSPLSRREVEHRLRSDRGRLAGWPLDEAQAARPLAWQAAQLTAFAVQGENPSPWYVLKDLALPSRSPGGASVAWSSSRPDVIGEDGRVRREAVGEAPMEVVLTAELSQGAERAQRELSFRVMPRRRTVPAYFLWVAEPMSRLSRVDAAVEFYPEGEGDAPQVRLAAQDNGAGVSLRGNSSLRQPKKPIGLRLEEPHGLWGTTNVCKINFITAWRDPTLLRNRLCYELFGLMGGPGRHDALPVQWAEIFVNGHYQGLYEASPPVRAEWLGFEPFRKGQSHPALVYKAQRASASLVETRLMRQIEPSRRHGHIPEPVIDLQRFLEEADAATFARELPSLMDVDNLLDFHLLLDLTENYNGWPFQYTIHDILARPNGADARFFLVPFDFDTTWDPHPVGKYTSRTFDRLLRDYPGYRERLAARWLELRAGPWRTKDIESRVRGYQALLAPYIAWDDRRWERDPSDSYERRVEMLLGQLRIRTAQLDQRHGR